MLRNEYIQQKDKGTKCMELFILMSCAEFLGLCLDRKSIYKSLTKKKRCSKQEIIEAVVEEHVCMWVCLYGPQLPCEFNVGAGVATYAARPQTSMFMFVRV